MLTENSPKKKVNGARREGKCLSIREVSVSFKTRGDVIVILINLRGGECNFP